MHDSQKIKEYSSYRKLVITLTIIVTAIISIIFLLWAIGNSLYYKLGGREPQTGFIQTYPGPLIFMNILLIIFGVIRYKLNIKIGNNERIIKIIGKTIIYLLIMPVALFIIAVIINFLTPY